MDSLWWCYGVTKDLTENNLLLVYHYDNWSVETIEIIKTIIETLKTIEDCAHCKDKEVGRNSFDEFRKLINEIEKEYYLVENLFKTNIRLNKEVLCEGCKKEQEIRKLADKCGNEEIAKFLYECRLDRKWYYDNYIRWIPFDKFKNTEYLGKGGFGEVHQAIWINYYNRFYDKYRDQEVVLERIYNSNDEIVDILKEVKQEFTVIITITIALKWK